MTKYRAQSVMVDGERFASQGEYRRWCDLRLLERAGQIKSLERQVSFPLEIEGRPVLIRSSGFPNGRKAKYTADFRYTENGVSVVEEYKGFDTAESRFRRAVAEAIHGFTIRITGAAAGKSGRAA